MTPEEVQTLFDYNAWANHRSLDAASTLTKEQFNQPMRSSFSSVRDTLAHVCGAELVWYKRFQGNSPSALPDLSSLDTIEALRMYWLEQEAKLLSLVASLTQADLDRVMEYKTLKFGVYRNPLWQALQHLANHGTYHRGQIATLLRQHGVKPILTDLMHFYRERDTARSKQEIRGSERT